MIDSHNHVGFEELKENAAVLVERAVEQGVEKMLVVACGSKQLNDLHSMLEQFPMVYGAFGVHPNEAQESMTSGNLSDIVRSHPKILGIGETGLDYHYEYTPHDLQRKSFEKHIEVAQELDIPLIIHSREAEDDTIKLMEKALGKKNFRGVFHCFTSSQKLADAAQEFGFYLSASGVITFNKSSELREIFKQVPLDRLLIETDSPYLAPVPNRGKQNEPAFLPYTLKMLSDIKGISRQEMEMITTNNFNRLFFKDDI